MRRGVLLTSVATVMAVSAGLATVVAVASPSQVTFVNAKGQIVSSGFAADSNPDVLAVIGGSGQYRGARG